MVVASANEFRTNQKKYLDLVKQDIQVFLKRGGDLFSITPVMEQQRVKVNPVWADHIKKAEEDIKCGNVTAVKSGDIWKKAREIHTAGNKNLTRKAIEDVEKGNVITCESYEEYLKHTAKYA
jgi:hypothetical protein